MKVLCLPHFMDSHPTRLPCHGSYTLDGETEARNTQSSYAWPCPQQHQQTSLSPRSERARGLEMSKATGAHGTQVVWLGTICYGEGPMAMPRQPFLLGHSPCVVGSLL